MSMRNIFQKGGKFLWAILTACVVMAMLPSHAALFSGSASISANDGTGALSATSANNYGQTMSCWFRISIPSSTNLTDNMTVLMDRSDGNENANYSYEVRFNLSATRLIGALQKGNP